MKKMLLTYQKMYMKNEIIGKHVQDQIANQINNLDIKYYFTIVDSTLDLIHVDQLMIVF